MLGIGEQGVQVEGIKECATQTLNYNNSCSFFFIDLGAWKVNNGKISSATIPKPKVVAPHDLLRFMSAKHVHGNWSMKFVAVAYSNCSRSVKKEYFDAPALLAHALKGVSLCVLVCCIFVSNPLPLCSFLN